jgi:hypothetical protein
MMFRLGKNSREAVLGLPVPGARVTDLDVNINFLMKGLFWRRRFWLLFLPQRKVTRTLTH